VINSDGCLLSGGRVLKCLGLCGFGLLLEGGKGVFFWVVVVYQSWGFSFWCFGRGCSDELTVHIDFYGYVLDFWDVSGLLRNSWWRFWVVTG